MTAPTPVALGAQAAGHRFVGVSSSDHRCVRAMVESGRTVPVAALCRRKRRGVRRGPGP